MQLLKECYFKLFNMFNKWTYGQIKLIPGFSSTSALQKNHRVNFFYYIKEKLQFSDIPTLSFSSIAGRPDSCKMVNLLFVSLHYILTVFTLHYITLHYITLHYITLHYITLHYITLHYITLLLYSYCILICITF